MLASCGMRIAVIGKGKIGGTLGSKWRAAGHDVVYGARDASGTGPGGAPVLGVGDALTDAEVVLLAVPGQDDTASRAACRRWTTKRKYRRVCVRWTCRAVRPCVAVMCSARPRRFRRLLGAPAP